MVLLVIDVQKLITTKRLYRYNDFIKNLKLLIAAARENGVEVIYVRHDDGAGKLLTKGTAGFEIFEEITPLSGDKVFDKTVNSSFKETGITEYLQSINEKTVVITGLQTDYCIDASVKCGFEHGFEIIVPAFANSTFDNEFMTARQSYLYYNEFIWKNRYAKCISVDETMELMKKDLR